MALITKAKLNSYADTSLREYNRKFHADSILFRETANFSKSPTQKYNIFLCHSSLDAKTILGLKKYFSMWGLTTYIDWYDDHQLDRSKVNNITANILRKRMQNSDCLLYALSNNSSSSKWMPWECGYFDGIKSKVAICPIAASSTQAETDQYNGLEYLSLYPYLTDGLNQVSGKNILWIHESPRKYVSFDEWLKGHHPKQHLK